MTRNLAKSEWLKDARGLEAVQAEGIGLRSNQTWSDDSVKLLWQLKQECRASGRKVQIAELLTLCGVKHFELHPTQHKYKGRVVFRGDQVRDASGNLVLFGSEETATTPTGLVRTSSLPFLWPPSRSCNIRCRCHSSLLTGENWQRDVGNHPT